MQKKSLSESLFLTVGDHTAGLVEWMSEGIYEKEQIAAMALLCAVAGENIFLLGPPGTAKSLVARRLKGVFRQARSFEYLMSRFSTPDEIFGPISISKLKDSDCYERLTDGYLPSADVVFLDEIWKAGPSIQNTLLTAVNEHIFQNGKQTMSLPMKVLIAASNELPAKNEGLEALWDRFLVRMVSNCIENDDNFEKMLLDDGADEEKALEERFCLTPELYSQWRLEAAATKAPPAVIEKIKGLRSAINLLVDSGSEADSDGAVSGDYYVSDRRWKKAFRLMKTSAFLNGRGEVDESDLLLLIHCLWNEPECRETVIDTLLSALWSETDAELESLNAELRKLVAREPKGGKRATAASTCPDADYAEYYNAYHTIEDYRGGTALITKWDFRKLSYVDEEEAVEITDNSLRMPVIRVQSGGRSFENEVGSPLKPEKVTVMKCAGGIVVNGVPYALTRKTPAPAKAARDPAVPVNRDISAVKSRYSSAILGWEKLKSRLLADAGRNLFVSVTDRVTLQKGMETQDAKFKELEIRINNIAKILV